MTKGPQIGASDRGPAELDQAKRNLRMHEGAVTRRDGDEEALSAGGTAEQRAQAEQRETAEAEKRWPQRLAPEDEPEPRTAEEDAEAAARRDDDPLAQERRASARDEADEDEDDEDD